MIDIKNKFLKGYKFIDLFCGIGGFHLALSSFGAKCVFACDINKAAKEIYEKNFGMKVHGDITKLDIQKDIPKHDIICAGFPCQAFSISGKRKGFYDDKGRGTLYKNVVEIAKVHKPKIIILENVKNLEKHDNGNTLEKIKSDFDEAGYDMFSRVLNASDFGIPQARKRIYIVGFRKDFNIHNFEFPKPKKNNIKLKDILQKDIDRIGFIVDREDVQLCEPLNERELIRVGKVGLGRQGERIYSINGSAITLSSQGGGVGGKTGMYFINDRVSKLTGRECARLMGFPDSFKISESSGTCYSQFGNSVVVDVLQHIIKNFKL